MQDDDALQEGTDTGAGWGGPRQKSWHTTGKRAVVHIPPEMYEYVVALARACRRPAKDLNAQVYAAGIEALTGLTPDDLRTQRFAAPLRAGARPARAMTHEEVREVANSFVKLVEAPGA